MPPRGRPRKVKTQEVQVIQNEEPATQNEEPSISSAQPSAKVATKRKLNENEGLNINQDVLPPINVLDMAEANDEQTFDIVEITRPQTALLSQVRKQTQAAIALRSEVDDFKADLVNKVADEYADAFKANMPKEKTVEVLEVFLLTLYDT